MKRHDESWNRTDGPFVDRRLLLVELPGAYVRRVRLERAIGLIVDTERPLAEIAYATGFADQSHMTRQVGEATGLPPGRLRATV